MIEAVNSVLQTAPVVRGNSEQISTVDSFAGNPERVQKIPLAPYVSPYIHVDVNYDTAVLQLRNGETGDVENQFPSQSQLEAQARIAARREVERQTQTEKASTPLKQADSAQADLQRAEGGGSAGGQGGAPVNNGNTISARQQAAFETAARSGNSNAGNITLFA